MKKQLLKESDFLRRLAAVREAAPKHSPLQAFRNAYPEYDRGNGMTRVRNTWNSVSMHFDILEKFEKLWLKKDNTSNSVSNSLLIAVMFGYQQCEKGNNLEMATENFKKTQKKQLEK